MPQTAVVSRDARIDFFRGLALVFIFIDHIPEDVLGDFTLHAVAFCDAAEVFIFLSGYSSGLYYGGAFRRTDLVHGEALLLRRIWTLYIAHIFVFMIYAATVSYTVETFHNPMFTEELEVGDFLTSTHVVIVKALLLQFQPAYLDILPLYIVLLALQLVLMPLARRHPPMLLVPSMVVYLVVQVWGWPNLPAYPEDRTWYFNPFAWQLLFCLGVALGLGRLAGRQLFPSDRRLVVAAAVMVVVSGVIKLSWTLHWHFDEIPALLIGWLEPMSKTNLAPLRLINFLALALLVEGLMTPRARLLETLPARAMIACGRLSLNIFCLGILLSVIGHFVLVELGSGLAMQAAVNGAGISIMVAVAYFILWFRRVERPPPAASPQSPVKARSAVRGE
jgi:hypothetical protein